MIEVTDVTKVPGMIGEHNILVVEDDVDIRECLLEILADAGYEVSAAGHGAEALALLERGMRPCLMVIDLLMPVMDGVELIERMRRDTRFESIPVLVLSAASAIAPPPGTRMLRKPPKYETLMGEIQRACPN
jgi:CheY-like chemotaxis protein